MSVVLFISIVSVALVIAAFYFSLKGRKKLLSHQPDVIGKDLVPIEQESEIPVPTDALIVGEVNRPLIAITPCTVVSRPEKYLVIPAALKDALGPLVQRAPEIFRLGKDMGTQTLKLVFSPEVTEALNSGNLQLLKDAAGNLLPSVQRNGKFFANGRVVVQGGLKLANIAAMSWQIASIATAQQYLGEINAKLKGIEEALEQIAFFLTEDKKSRLRAYVDLLRQYHPALTRGNLHPNETAAIYQKFEDLEHEALSIADLGKQLASRKLEELQTLDISTWFGRSDTADKAAKLIKENEEAMELVFLAQSCRILGCQVKAALPGDRHLLQERLKHAALEVRDTERQFHQNRERFLERIEGLKKREDNYFALRGMFDTDYHQGLDGQYHSALVKAEGACLALERESMQAGAFSNQIDLLAKDGIAIILNVEPSGHIELLSAGPSDQ